MSYDLIIMYLVIAYAHKLYYKNDNKKFHFNEYKRDTWKCDWLTNDESNAYGH